jgi:hypothetical protein
VASAEVDQAGAAEQQDGAGHEQTDRQPGQEVHLGAHAHVGSDPGRGVGVHDHGGPVAALRVPRQRLLAGSGRGRGPEVLLRRRSGGRIARSRVVPRSERVVLDIREPVVLDAPQVCLHVARRADADEQVTVGRLQADIAKDLV